MVSAVMDSPFGRVNYLFEMPDNSIARSSIAEGVFPGPRPENHRPGSGEYRLRIRPCKYVPSSNDRFRTLRVLSHCHTRSLEDAAFFLDASRIGQDKLCRRLKKEELKISERFQETEIVWNPEVKPLNHLLCPGMNRIENRDAKLVAYEFNPFQYIGEVLLSVDVLLPVCGDQDVFTLLYPEPGKDRFILCGERNVLKNGIDDSIPGYEYPRVECQRELYSYCR